MKQVSWEFAFRRLKAWEKLDSVIVGEVLTWESQGETISMFRSKDWPAISLADQGSGKVTFTDGRIIDLMGATLRFSTYEDSPFGEAGIGSMEDAEEQLEATFPDGSIFVFVLEDRFNR